MNYEKKRIFIVDDQEINLFLMRSILEDDYQIQSFTSGQSCLQAFKDEPVDLVLLDVEMPELDGLDTCRRLLEIEPQCPVLFVSANCSDDERLAGYSAGGYDYISRPCNADELLAKLRIIFDHQKKRNEVVEINQNITKAFMEVSAGNGEQGILIRFAVAVAQTHTHKELAEALIYSLGELNGLKASVLIKGKHKNLFWSDRGECCPIEVQVLEALRCRGRFYEFNNRLQVNEEHVSVLIKNMPEDEMARGRYKDHIPLLLQIASSMAYNQDTVKNLTKDRQRMDVVQSVCNKLTDSEASLHKHISCFINVIEVESERMHNEIQHLALSEEQEEKLMFSIDTTLKQTLISGEEALDVSSRFGGFVKELKEAF